MDKVKSALLESKAYLMNKDESEKLAKILFKKGKMNPEIVGKTAKYIADLAGLTNVPENVSVLVACETSVGEKHPYSQEKLAPVLALYAEESIDKILQKCIEILNFEGIGHSFIMHCDDEETIKRFAKEVPASRIIVNSPGSVGGIGGTTNLFPALTLGCGASGGSSTSNNISPLDLINIKRVALGTRELDKIRQDKSCESDFRIKDINQDTIEYIVNSVMKKLI